MLLLTESLREDDELRPELPRMAVRTLLLELSRCSLLEVVCSIGVPTESINR